MDAARLDVPEDEQDIDEHFLSTLFISSVRRIQRQSNGNGDIQRRGLPLWEPGFSQAAWPGSGPQV